jgi:hypothetical protein
MDILSFIIKSQQDCRATRGHDVFRIQLGNAMWIDYCNATGTHPSAGSSFYNTVWVLETPMIDPINVIVEWSKNSGDQSELTPGIYNGSSAYVNICPPVRVSTASTTLGTYRHYTSSPAMPVSIEYVSDPEYTLSIDKVAKVCYHNWKEYVGLVQRDWYCTYCNEKRDSAP